MVSLINPHTGELRFFLVPGLNFGLVAAVTQFNRVPEFCVHVMRRIFDACVSHFFDDYPVCEPDFSARSAQQCLVDFHILLGLPLSEDKQEKCEPINKYLGIENDFSRSGVDGTARVRMTQSRREQLVKTITDILECGTMSPAEASSLHGKCQFAITAPFGKVGRSVLILLRERWHQPNPPFWLPPALRRGLHFLLQLVRQLPDFVVWNLCCLPFTEKKRNRSTCDGGGQG